MLTIKKTNVYVPTLVVNKNSDFVKIYRLVIDYINPFNDIKYQMEIGDNDYGIPILFINPETDMHINSYYNTRFIDMVLNGFMSTANLKDSTGYNWIVSPDGKFNTGTQSKNGGSNHGRGLGNVYGRKLINEKIENNLYRQTYEFTGALNEHFDSIDIGLMLPVYRNVSTKKYTYTIIKNIIFSCDTLTTTTPDTFFVNDNSLSLGEKLRLTIDDDPFQEPLVIPG